MRLAPLLVCLPQLMSLFAFAGDKLTLMDAYQAALKNDQTYQAALSEYAAAKFGEPKALSHLGSNINFSASYVVSRTNSSPETITNSAATSNGAVAKMGVNLTRPLFNLQKSIDYDQSKLRTTIAETQEILSKQELILNVSRSYFDILLAQDNLTLVQAQKNSIEAQLALAKSRFETGQATILEVNEAQGRLDIVLALIKNAESELSLKISILTQSIDTPFTSVSRLKQNVQLNLPNPNDVDQWVLQAGESNLLYQIQKTLYDISKTDVDKAKSLSSPTLDLIAGYNITRANPNDISASVFDTTMRGASVGVVLNIPLYTSGYNNAAVGEARALQGKKMAEMTGSRRNAIIAARQSFNDIVSSVNQSLALQQAVISSQTVLDATGEGFRLALRTNNEVLNAQQQVLSTQRDLARVRYEHFMNHLKIKGAVGTLTESDLQEIQNLFEQ